MNLNKYKKIIISLLFFMFFIGFHSVLAQGNYNFASSSGLDTTANNAGYTESLKKLDPSQVAIKTVNTILTFLGVIFMGLMIYGGITWMTAEGNEQKVEKAKQIIVTGIVGLIIVLAAYAASYFIVSYFSNVTTCNNIVVEFAINHRHTFSKSIPFV